MPNLRQEEFIRIQQHGRGDWHVTGAKGEQPLATGLTKTAAIQIARQCVTDDGRAMLCDRQGHFIEKVNG